MEYNAREELLKKLKKQQRLREDIPWERCIKYLREKFGITGDMAPYVQIRLLRSKLNLTQEEMMVLFDADEASKISRWERQINVPRAAARENLFKYFGIPVDAWDIQNEKKFIPQRSLHEREKDYPPIWNIPFDEPSLFVGREDVLQHLYNAFSSEKVLSLTQAVSGLGGVGKTSTVLRYVYKYRGEYQAIWWIDASTQESLMAGLLSLAKQIRKIPDSKSQESSFVLDIVKKWMKETPHWLLVLDNVDDIALVYNNDIFPTSRRGHILLTTRTQSVGSSIQNIELESLNSENGALLLLNTAGLMNANKTLYDVVEQDRQNALHLSHLVGGLPLALTYAGAYIREVQCSLAAYIRLYESREMELLRWRSSSYINKKFAYPNSVATTWTLSFEKVEQSSPAAVDLLRLYSFLSPDAIPEEIAIDGSSRLGFNLQGVRDTFAFDQVIVELRRYSLVNRNAENRTVNIHRLVQIVFRDRMDVEIQREWVEKTIGAVNLTLSMTKAETLPDFERYVLHLQMCAELIRLWMIVSEDAASLLFIMGEYFREAALYNLAEKNLQQCEKLYEQMFGSESEYVAVCENRLAMIYLSQEKFEQAEEHYKKSLTLSENIWGVQHPNVASILHELAHLSRLRGRYDAAEVYYNRALDGRLNVLASDDPAVAISLNGLASLYQDQRMYEEAEPLFKQAIEINQKALNADDPRLTTNYYNLAVNYACQKKYEEAEPLCKQALTNFEKVLGKEHDTVAQALNVLAEIYHYQGKYEEAEPLFQQSLQIREKLLGTAHTDVAQSFVNIGALRESQGKYEESEAYYKKAQRLIEEALGPLHPKMILVLINYLSLLKKMGRKDEAQELNIRIQSILEANT